MHRYTIVVDGKPFTLDVRELGADEFRVQVDGRELDVKLADDQELAEGTISPAIASISEVTLPRSESPLPQPRPVSGRAGAQVLSAPLPGVIVSIDVKSGDAVRRGDVLLTLEAMKMRNEIRAARDAVVEEVVVQEGQSVGFGDALVRFGEPK